MVRILLFFLVALFSNSVLAQEPPPADPQAVELRTRIESVLDRIPEFGEVEVEVGQDVVTLSGPVPTGQSRENADALVSKIEGVLWVDNNLSVTEPSSEETARDPSAADDAIQEKLAGIFANVPDLQDVEVRVRAGVVRLDGKILAESTADKAVALAKSLDGVVYVDNGLTEVRGVQKRVSPALQKTRDIVRDFIATVPLFIVGLLILILFYSIGRGVTSVGWFFRRLNDKPLVQGIARQVIRVVIFSAGILLVLELFDLTALVGAVLGTAGVAGLALGFAFRDIVENYLASIMLSLRQPFEKNDFVRIDTYEGKVVRLSIRETVLMTADGNHLRIPNAVVFKSIIYNFTRNPLRRFDFGVGVGSGEDLREALQLGTATVKATPGVLAEPACIGTIDALADSTVDLRFYAWVDQRESSFVNVRSASMRALKEAFDAAGIDMPEPTTRVLQRTWEPPPPRNLLPAPVRHLDLEPDAADPIDEQIARERAESDETDLLK